MKQYNYPTPCHDVEHLQLIITVLLVITVTLPDSCQFLHAEPAGRVASVMAAKLVSSQSPCRVPHLCSPPVAKVRSCARLAEMIP